MERGLTYVVANIRGGGEFGPSWHQAALKKNRHKAFEDFEAVARDLIDTGVTTSEQLAIFGGSNGGLLVGSVFTRNPDLCAGVICAVPLLDMLRYHRLLAGASWVGEYGDPTDDDMASYLASYSPFHNVKPDVDYPTVFFVTSTRDDRVHPGHARQDGGPHDRPGPRRPLLREHRRRDTAPRPTSNKRPGCERWNTPTSIWCSGPPSHLRWPDQTVTVRA